MRFNPIKYYLKSKVVGQIALIPIDIAIAVTINLIDLITDVDIVRQKTDYHLFQLQEHFNATRNKIENLGDELANLSALRTLNCRHNRLVDEGIPKDVFSLEDLQVVV